MDRGWHFALAAQNFGICGGCGATLRRQYAFYWAYRVSVATATFEAFSDLALDSKGHAYIAFCDILDGISYATNASGVWQAEFLNDADLREDCSHTSLVLDTDGNAHISYINAGKYLTYITNKSGTWVKSSLARIGSLGSNPAYPASIALDDTDNVHISYFGANSHLEYITNK